MADEPIGQTHVPMQILGIDGRQIAAGAWQRKELGRRP